MSVNYKRRRDTAAAAATSIAGDGLVMDLSTISISSRVCTGSSNKENHDLNISSSSKKNSIMSDIQSAITTKQRLIAFHRLRKMLQKSNHANKDRNTTAATSSLLLMEDNSQCTATSRLNTTTNTLTMKQQLEQFIVKDGGFTTIMMQLHHLVYTHGSTVVEIELVCNCLAIIFRSIRRKGDSIIQYILQYHASDVLILLSNATSVAAQRRQQQNQKIAMIGTTDESIHSIQYDVVAIFSAISSSYIGTNRLLKCRIAIETLVRTFRFDPIMMNENNSGNCYDDNILLEALDCFKNLTYYQENCHLQLIRSFGLIHHLGGLLLQPPAGVKSSRWLSIKSRQRLSAVIRNLTMTIECRTLLVAHPPMIDTLIQLLDWEEPPSPSTAPSLATTQAWTTTNKNKNMDDTKGSCSNNMQRNVINSLVSLAMDHDSALILIFYGDGILLRILQRYLKVSPDVFVRKKSACILRLLAHEVSAPLLVHDANLMYSLSDAALRDDSSDVRKEAAEAFARCAAVVQVVEQQPLYYDSVLDALTALVQTRRGRLKTVAIDSLARALREQSSHECNQRPMADRKILLDAIAEIAISKGGESESSTASRDATYALMNLSDNDDNLEKLATNPVVLDAILVTASSYRTTTTTGNYNNNGSIQDDEEDGKTSALTTLANLTRNINCRTILLRHQGGCLLQTMIQEIKYIPTEQGGLKERLKQAALLLASEL